MFELGSLTLSCQGSFAFDVLEIGDGWWRLKVVGLVAVESGADPAVRETAGSMLTRVREPLNPGMTGLFFSSM